ncbi:MAG: carbamoyltransferase [Ignavibacteriales bacterium]|nr:carbamoyltransferase [Ignavibacteriales bacterium]
MNILGISCFYHDAAAALLADGQLVAAAQEERFTRKRHDSNFPINAIRYCLSATKISANSLDYVVFYDKPFIKFERILQTYFGTFPRSFRSFLKALPVWMKEKMWIRQTIMKELDYAGEVLFTEHHMSHAASAFLVSPFEEAAILTLDGVGEWETTTKGWGRGNEIQLTGAIHFPHSLGLLYSAFTYYLGFRVNSAEYKVMGLAPYGEPRFADTILQELVNVQPDGTFCLNMKYFTYHYGLTMTGKKIETLFGHPRREPESTLEQFHKDMAASIQKVTDTIVVRLAQHIERESKMKSLCMAGGVALNCVANSKIFEHTNFQDIFVQPAAGDAGGAIGAAFYIYNTVLGNRRSFVMRHAFLGPEFNNGEVEELFRTAAVSFRKLEQSELLKETARLLDAQKVIGWFQGRMEFGPRALGARSILADARNPKNQSVVNLKIKYRESFRPFAPTVLEEKTSAWFDWNRPSPFMLFIAQAKNGKERIPAVTHSDGSARLQTISRDQNSLYYDLVSEFDKLTGCPVIINTSFNQRGEPIVCTPQDAWKCFLRTEMDHLVIGNFLVNKSDVPPYLVDEARKETFEPD